MTKHISHWIGGKPWTGEADRCGDEFAFGIPHLFKGRFSKNVSTGVGFNFSMNSVPA
jgi:hypothetical protein